MCKTESQGGPLPPPTKARPGPGRSACMPTYSPTASRGLQGNPILSRASQRHRARGRASRVGCIKPQKPWRNLLAQTAHTCRDREPRLREHRTYGGIPLGGMKALGAAAFLEERKAVFYVAQFMRGKMTSLRSKRNQATSRKKPNPLRGRLR